MKNEICIFLDCGAPSLYNKYIRKFDNPAVKGSSLENRKLDDFGFVDSVDYREYRNNYVKFLQENQDLLDVYSNLDVINNPEKTWENQQFLEAEGLHPIPIYHFGCDLKWLELYINKGYEYMAIGGMIPNPPPVLLPALDNIWGRYLTDDKGMPIIKVHGFAATSFDLMTRYPWYSCDSIDGTSLLLVKEAGRIRVETIEELYYSALGKKEKLKSGHDRKALKDVEVFVPDKNGKGKWVIAAGVIRHKVAKRRYLVRTKRGREISVTGDHGLFVKREGREFCVSAKELIEKQDQVIGVDYQEPFGNRKEITINIERAFYRKGHGKNTAFRKKLPIKVELDNRFLEFLGLWVADGSYRKGGDAVALSVGNDVECYSLVEEIAAKWDSSFTVNKENNIDMFINSAMLSRTICHLGFGLGSKNKEIPWWIFELPKEGIGAFLRGYFSGDGTVTSTGPVECGTVSPKLWYGIFNLLTKMEMSPIQSRLEGRKYIIDGKKGWASPGYRLGINIVRDLQVFKRDINFLQKFKKEKLDQTIASRCEDRGMRSEQKEQEIFLQCNEVRSQGVVKGRVYDLDIPDGQRFVTNGLLVHNSTSWILIGAYGAIWVPKTKNGQWIYNETPLHIFVSSRSPQQKNEGRHINSFSKMEIESIETYLNSKGFTLGKSEFKKENASYKLKENESWYKTDTGERLVEVVVEPGVSNKDSHRVQINAMFMYDFQQTLPPWPCPFLYKKKSRFGFSKRGGK